MDVILGNEEYFVLCGNQPGDPHGEGTSLITIREERVKPCKIPHLLSGEEISPCHH